MGKMVFDLDKGKQKIVVLLIFSFKKILSKCRLKKRLHLFVVILG